jgi:hypothetical protein
MTDVYDRGREDLQYRKDVALSMGVGFELPKTLIAKQRKPPESDM